MKKTLMLVLVTLATVALPGTAWADCSTAPGAEAAGEAPAAAPLEGGTSQVIQGPSFEPMGGAGWPSCERLCRETWGACMFDCGQLPPQDQPACEMACQQDLQNCLNACP